MQSGGAFVIFFFLSLFFWLAEEKNRCYTVLVQLINTYLEFFGLFVLVCDFSSVQINDSF